MEAITIETTIEAPIEKVWQYFNDPKHITQWNFAHESWHCPSSENHLEVGGKFINRMEAKDQSFGFDLVGIYDEIIPEEKLRYHLEDGRKVETLFKKLSDHSTKVTQVFEPESQNSPEIQKQGWFSILNQFKKYTENN